MGNGKECQTCKYKMTHGHDAPCRSCKYNERADVLKNTTSFWDENVFPDAKPDQDIINHPDHYTQGRYETIDIIEDWQLEYHEANALKYISRAKYKGKRVEDLKKAKWYLDRKIKLLESE